MNDFTVLSDYWSALPYYGGKSKLSKRYSPPKHDLIIEPFAGGAAYSLRYYNRNVWLNDLNHETVAAWRFLTSGDAALHFVRRRIPLDVAPGTPLADLIRDDDPDDFKCFIQANMAKGAFGMRSTRRRVSPFGAQAWSSAGNGAGGLRDKCEYWIPKVRHWKVTHLHYDQLPNQKATWYVDPPYANDAGRKYAVYELDHNELSTWCRARAGQVIVCENNGATWLPFRPLTNKRIGIYGGCVKSMTGEAVWEHSDAGEHDTFAYD